MTDEVQSEFDKSSTKACCYEPVERLGTGGMGEVWRARHGLLKRPAAIKFIRPEVLGIGRDEVTRRLVNQFEHEAQATAALNRESVLLNSGISLLGMANQQASQILSLLG